ncbi:DUF6232 family protein [Actinoplanes auranticolor]|uniref:Uncharacterized protein n=1 Tax=Actinoplanes auranticolor TaxID=47988 RepID=A0A919SV86_9ACTN|nr:DUF6232 family protein [Actinoplanes auranticolor]GIM79117.1 hypothetical protein Aau02nite_84160 [Actinoplanes auranticolor]
MSIDRTSPSTPRCGWAVYYADRHIIVTSWYVQTPAARYRIPDLADVAVVLDTGRGPRWREIRAVHRGAEVVLFGTADRARFERVRRALIRALEINRSPFP